MAVRVTAENFDVGAETAALLAACPHAGGLASFLGVVRSTPENPITALVLEHYPAMTQRALERLEQDAKTRFTLQGCTIIHRHGHLLPGENIVLVLAAAAHRQQALEAVSFLIDWLKTCAPFWKKEVFASGEAAWVAAREADEEAAARW